MILMDEPPLQMDEGKISFLILLDISAALDAVNHDILLDQLNDLKITSGQKNLSFLEQRRPRDLLPKDPSSTKCS